MIDELITRLADDLKPVPSSALVRRLALAVLLGLAASAVLMVGLLGLRPDLRDATGTVIFWIKSGYTGGLSLAGIWAVERLGRPGQSGRLPLTVALAILLAMALAAIVDYGVAPVATRRTIVLGSSALICPFNIMALAVPFLISGIILMRQLAPTNLTLAGASAGLMAGALGAWVYSFHCTEEGLPFLALWYSIGVVAVMSIGAVLGKVLLRW